VLSSEEIDVVVLSLRVAAMSVGASLVPGILVAWLLARWEHPLRALLHVVVMLPLVLPPVVTGYLLLAVFGRSAALGQWWYTATGGHIAYTQVACVLAAAIVGFPLMVESIRLAILGIDPRLEQISRSLGRGRLDTFLRITLPLSLPGVLAGAVIGFARSLGEFGATIVVAGSIEGETRTIPIAVYTLLNMPGGEAATWRLVAVSIILCMLALLAAFAISRRDRARRAR
jgi:molybdate transport system permease protein